MFWEESNLWRVSPGNLSPTLVRMEGDAINKDARYPSLAKWEERSLAFEGSIENEGDRL